MAPKESRKTNHKVPDRLAASAKAKSTGKKPPPASRKRAAEFFDSTSEAGDRHQSQTQPPRLKKIKKTEKSGQAAQDSGELFRAKPQSASITELTKVSAPSGKFIDLGDRAVKKRQRSNGSPLKTSKRSQNHKPHGELGITAPKEAKATKDAMQTSLKEGSLLDEPKGGDTRDSASESSDNEHDQTSALLKGFESSETDDISDEQEELDDRGLERKQQLPDIPSTKKTRSELARIKPNGESGVVYIGHLPHGFYEHEMRAYFSQFGSISRLRLSRNRRTGQSKHYAFIEFASSDVARIAADTMNNYLLFGHILKCRTIPKEQIHENLWKGANRRFKIVPRNKIEGRKLEMAKPRNKWAKRVELEAVRRQSKVDKLRLMGYEFDLPILKSVDRVPKSTVPKLLDGNLRKGAAEDGLPVLVVQDNPTVAKVADAVVTV